MLKVLVKKTFVEQNSTRTFCDDTVQKKIEPCSQFNCQTRTAALGSICFDFPFNSVFNTFPSVSRGK